MNLYALLEPLLVGLIVATSLAFALRRFTPRRFAGNQGQATPLASDCSAGCGACHRCATPSLQNSHLVVFHRHRHQALPDTTMPRNKKTPFRDSPDSTTAESNR